MTNIATLPTRGNDKPMNTRVGRNVRYIMSERDVNQVELAVKLGLTESQMSRRLAGKVDWAPDDIALAAKALDVSVDLLFTLELPRLDSNQQPIGYKPGLLTQVDFRARKVVS